ncbi:unnamed protein product [Ostreobium quekettii]|uniref:Uncharacterized protein n=1 Tax=Ostreobium quekettii TaxID=121088 RepID=A0A8S1IYX2_9CHLO|nr:unnamed protein product [Ostreobium quekettii]
MDPSREAGPRSASVCRVEVSGGEEISTSLVVPLSKRAVFSRVVLSYAAVAAAAVALVQLGGGAETRAALGLLVIAIPRVFLGGALLFEQAAPLEVDAWAGLRVRHTAILGETFSPWRPTVEVGWDEIERWELVPATLPLGIPCPWPGEVLRVTLKQPQAFVAQHGRMRFGWKAFRHGTPLVVSDAVLQGSVREISEFMAKMGPGDGGAHGGPRAFQVVPLPAIPFAVVVQ